MFFSWVFLLTGVLSDYKESERLPGELAASIESIAEEALTIYKNKNAPAAKECLTSLCQLTTSIKNWFYKKERSRDVMEKISGLSDFFFAFESLTQATFIARLKQEQANIRRIMIRIHTVRETSFVSSGYLIAEVTTILLSIGLILSKIDPFHEALFFVGVITFLLTFLILLIKDLDNPFGYYESGSTEDVSLKPLDDLIEKLTKAIYRIGIVEESHFFEPHKNLVSPFSHRFSRYSQIRDDGSDYPLKPFPSVNE